jgi:glutaminyl-peptide cyclotransferase
MSRRVALTLGAVALAAVSCHASRAATQIASAFDADRAFEHLREMVAMGPRPAGSAALRQVRAYVTRELSSYGLIVEEQKFIAETPVGAVEMTNLAVKLPGTRPDNILLTGHYDTKPLRDSVFVGASDGASSAAMLLELARVLKTSPHQYTYEIVWFDGEEAFCRDWDECGKPDSPDNTYGSRYYVQDAKKQNALGAIKANILVDMIGATNVRLQKDGYSAPWLNDIVWTTAKELGYGANFVNQNTKIEDDHLAFVNAGIPSIDLIDLNDYPQWHNAVCCDDLQHVSAQSLKIVGDTILASLPKIESHLSGR